VVIGGGVHKGYFTLSEEITGKLGWCGKVRLCWGNGIFEEVGA
jgi:hypothetical protein